MVVMRTGVQMNVSLCFARFRIVTADSGEAQRFHWMDLADCPPRTLRFGAPLFISSSGRILSHTSPHAT